MVRTRTRLSQIPVTRETAVVGTVSRSDTWETQGIVRNERWVKDGYQHRHVLESLCKVLSAVAPHTPQKAMPCRSHGSFLDHAPPSTNRFTCCSLGLSISIGWSQFGSCATSTSSIAPPWPNGSSSSLSGLGGQRGFFDCASVLCCSSPLQHSSAPAVSPALSICRHVGPTWWSKAWLNIARCGGC